MSFGDDALDPQNVVEAQREAALRRAHSSLKSITHGHDVQVQRNRGDKSATCNCNACQSRRECEKALETYERA